MTQPDQLFPDGAVNKSSFAAFAAKTQEEWEDEQRGAEVDRWGILSFLVDIPFIGDILSALQGIDLSSPGAVLTAIVNAVAEAVEDIPVVGELAALIANLVNGGQPVNAINLFGSLLPGLFSNVPIGALNNEQPNLLTAGSFPTESSIADNPIWSWDSTVTHSSDGSGSAKVTADGSRKALRSNVVQAGRPVELSVWVKWSSLTFTGAPLQLHVVEFDSGGAQVGDPVSIDTLTPGGSSGGWSELSGTYTPNDGVSSYCTRLVVTADATAGTVWFDDGSNKQTGNIQQEWVQDLVADLAALLDWVENVVDSLLDALGLDALGSLADRIFDLADEVGSWFGDTQNAIGDILDLGGNLTDLISRIFSGLTGSDDDPGLDFGDLIDAVKDALQNIPILNILGFGGPATAGETFQSTWDQLISGFVGQLGTGTGLADLFNIAQEIASRATLGLFSWDILGIRNNKPISSGLLPTSESTVALDKVALQSTAPTFGVTQSTAIMGFQRIAESGVKGAVSWLGQGVTNITAAFVNIFKMDTSTGDLELVHASSDIVGDLSGSMQYNIYEIPDPIQVEPGEVYGIEIAVRGAGTHSVVGQSTWLPDHPGVYPRRPSAVRDSGTSAAPSTISSGSVGYASNVPFIEFAVSAGDVDIPRTPDVQSFDSSVTLPVPSWANNVEVVALGGGGGGRQGGTWGISGEGGENGNWSTDTWVRDTDFVGTPSLSITVGSGGSGGSGNGGNGGNSTVTLPVTSGHSSQTVTATGGEGGDALNALGSDKEGQSPGSITYGGYGGFTYVGGPTQSTFGGKGAAPGGGGAGGNWVSFQGGGNGAKGRVWIRFTQ